MAAGVWTNARNLSALLGGAAALISGAPALALQSVDPDIAQIEGPDRAGPRPAMERGWRDRDGDGAPMRRAAPPPAAPRAPSAEMRPPVMAVPPPMPAFGPGGGGDRPSWRGPSQSWGQTASPPPPPPPPAAPGGFDRGRNGPRGDNRGSWSTPREQGWNGQGWNGRNGPDRRDGDGRPGGNWNGGNPGRPDSPAPGWNGDADRNRDNDRRWDNDRRRDNDRRWDDNRRWDNSPNWNRGPNGNRGPSWNGNRAPDWSSRRDTWSSRGDRAWDRRWREDRRYDWRGWRSSHREIYRLNRYFPPYRNYVYRRLGIGFFLDNGFFGASYWIGDPWMYRLPPVWGPYRWVRYYDDALMVNIYTGEVVDVLYDVFW